MLKQTIFAMAALCGALAAPLAMAGADCPANPKDQWMTESAFQKKAVNDLGYVIYKFKVDGECYEIYGKAPKEGDANTLEKVEAYFNTATGEVVKKKVED